MGGWLARVAEIRPGEGEAVALSFLYIFLLMTGYYILKPVRDALGLELGASKLPSLFLAGMVVMYLANVVYGWLVNRWPRHVFIGMVYRFFAVNLVLFAIAFRAELSSDMKRALIAGYFQWVSVFNLFVVAIFWSFMNDVWDVGQGKRLFGLIGAGAITGALTGSFVTRLLVALFRAEDLLVVSAVMLEACVQLMQRVHRLRGAREPAADPASERPQPPPARPAASGASGLALLARSRYLRLLALFTFLLTSSNTFVYFQLNAMVEREVDGKEARTAYFAGQNTAVNVLGLLVQVVVTGQLLTRCDIRVGLTLVPLVMLAGAVCFLTSPGLAVIATAYVVATALHYSVNRASREVLYTPTAPEEKYKAKNFIDTLVYRVGDATSASIVEFLKPLLRWAGAAVAPAALTGLAASSTGKGELDAALIAGIGLLTIAFALARIAVAWFLGREFNVTTRRPREDAGAA